MKVLVNVGEYESAPLRPFADVPDLDLAPKRVLVVGTVGYAEAVNATEMVAGLPIAKCSTEYVEPRDRVQYDAIINLND